MRTRIKVMDLTEGQWNYLQAELDSTMPVPDGAVRMCVEFELAAQGEVRHVEMSARSFVAMITRVQDVQDLAEAALTPDVEPRCDHGSPVVHESPSMWRDGKRHPVREYADGCQSFGPYPSVLDK